MGDELDLASVYDEHAEALFAFLLNLTRNESDSRDALQEVFCKLARNPSVVAKATNPRAVLVRIAHNAAVDAARRYTTRTRREELFVGQKLSLFDTPSDPDAETFQTELAAALGDLPPEQRAVVHLKVWEGMTFEQIAQALGIEANTAASRYRYGLDKLRARLRPIYEEIK